MADTTIEWTDKTWNPVTGCVKVSPGCKHCYAEGIAKRFWGERRFTDVICHEDRLEQPLHWRKPGKIFVNSMSDLFHAAIPNTFIERVFDIMARCPQHTFQILTKRASRLRDMLEPDGELEFAIAQYWPGDSALAMAMENGRWPLPNVWMGVSVENQTYADERIPLLLQTRAAVRWISAEPLLGPINLESVPLPDAYLRMAGVTGCAQPESEKDTEPDDYRYWTRKGMKLNWVVVGGESGPGARPMNPDWARSLRDQCVAAGVPFLFKQWGAYEQGVTEWGNNKKRAGRLLDGREWNEYPQLLNIPVSK